MRHLSNYAIPCRICPFFITLVQILHRTMKALYYRIHILLALVAVMLSSCSSFVAIERNHHASSDSAFLHYLRSENIPVTSNNNVEILNGAHAKFARMLDDISKAKHHVHLEYFNFRNDSITRSLSPCLRKRLKKG